ncbi:MAG: hypothetical protein KKC71_11615 [Chloroflexi bacterium]|nr:hypothetical protein [Chloroflexota bacterium]
MQKRLIYVVFVAGALIGGGYFLYRTLRPSLARSARVVEWIRNPPSRPSAMSWRFAIRWIRRRIWG